MAAAAACVFAVLTPQRVEAADTEQAMLATQAREFAEANADAFSSARASGASEASDVSASAALCIDTTYSDPIGDAGVIDVESYTLRYSCGDKLWSISAVDSNDDSETSTDSYALFVDRDRNEATGCGSFDRIIVAFWNDIDELEAGAVNTPSCDQSRWTPRNEDVAVEFSATDTIAMVFPHSVINTTTFGWGLLWTDINDEADAMPNGPVRNTILPGVSTIQFRTLQYNAPGTDTSSNSSLNNEWVGVRNYGSTTKNLKGYTVRDAQNNVYTFKTNFYLLPNKSVRLHTGRGANTATDVYWNRTAHVWGNTRDTAILRNADRVTKDTCSWTTSGTGSKVCPT
jgi:hypothetical protein